jgi:hypothetical protein
MRTRRTTRTSKALAGLAAVTFSLSALGVFVAEMDSFDAPPAQLRQQVLPPRIDPSPRLQMADAVRPAGVAEAA